MLAQKGYNNENIFSEAELFEKLPGGFAFLRLSGFRAPTALTPSRKFLPVFPRGGFSALLADAARADQLSGGVDRAIAGFGHAYFYRK
jgi:hypothetical protein